MVNIKTVRKCHLFQCHPSGKSSLPTSMPEVNRPSLFLRTPTPPNIWRHQQWTACLPCKPMIWPSRITISATLPKRYIIADNRQQVTPSKVHHQNVLKVSAHVPNTGLDWLNLKEQKKRTQTRKTRCWISSRRLASVLVVVAVLRPSAPRVYRVKTWEGPRCVGRCSQVRSAVKICHSSSHCQAPDQTNNTTSESLPHKCQHIRAVHPKGAGQCVCIDKASEEKVVKNKKKEKKVICPLE